MEWSFRPGQRVHVEFDAEVASKQPYTTLVHLYSNSGALLVVNAKDVTPLDPENWPPQIGDIWEANGREYFARSHRGNDLWLVLDGFETREFYSDAPGYSTSHKTLDQFKALNPTLARRR